MDDRTAAKVPTLLVIYVYVYVSEMLEYGA